MNHTNFDEDAAIKNLKRREEAVQASGEELRQRLLQKVTEILQRELKENNLQVWLIGSITKAGAFSQRSDIDIIIKNYSGDRFALWSFLEDLIGHDIEIIRYEECDFQEEILKTAFKVL